MKNNDIELIRLTLDGDDTAFAKLVEKYRSAVHALVWRKIGDFHIAEEITQDVFLHAYNQLGSIKKPQSFASWLYVSASRRCLAWHRKKRLPMKSFEDISEVQDEDTTYSQFVVNENQRVSEEAQRDVVKKLLAKLPESERTVLTLHYFSEMSSFEIGAFLGVSANTIRS
ncbi:RNA polymerase sigma factor, partial [Candidatus Poribacteria bacterium]|nr:RNA polymerase sigma factor [Candidatus Poribacteria bacterium]